MSHKSSNLTFVIVLGSAMLVVVVLLVLYGDRESPTQVTLTRLHQLEKSVVSFVEQHGRAPEHLAELDLPEEQVQDHLGVPFIYKVEHETVTITSFGSDKEPGGHFFKRDHIRTFKIKK